MHLSMYDHKIIQKNIKKCKKNGIKIIDPIEKGNKAKLANIDEVGAFVIREIGKQDFNNKKVLVIGGSTAEDIDDVRIIANRSSGKTAIWLAKNAFYRGADVELWHGWRSEIAPNYINKEKFNSINDILKLLKSKKVEKFDIIIICAALADYMPKKTKGKIPSGKKELVIECLPAPKIIKNIRKIAPKSKLIGFKVEDSKNKLEEKAFDLLKNNNLDLVVANKIIGFDSEVNEIEIIDKKKKIMHFKGKKEILADSILDSIIKLH
jgi:phosphopantothenoylcysteine decarboxylase/phosphopantothenate--cysteine ligase